MQNTKTKVWIDLDNAPHVPFFAPIIRELKARGHGIWVTARGRYQVSELATMHGIEHTLIGKKHYGKNKVVKALGIVYRAVRLAVRLRREKPDIALSHGSRSQILAAKLSGIPVVVIIDYEHARKIPFIKYDVLIIPEVIPDSAISASCFTSLCKYQGIKEDVYIPGFQPSGQILQELGIDMKKVVVTVRPPATDAHYHNVESEKLFAHVVEWISGHPGAVMVVLPRNKKQEKAVQERWPELIDGGKLVIPKSALLGLNLIWHSDLVISGGGTMNREAAALGVPVYSIFRGETGSVDRYLAQERRMILIQNTDDVERLITLAKRERREHSQLQPNGTLHTIVDHLEKALLQQ
ncbi:DUF354 domain-containing protein [Geomonas sp. RF6]|uniref:DUF354 domain-containing protein n=1 Tax=Geomonas sp. RF6 TaxID=2897342 RepID=UPI001E41B828|nr:DUF354 domain-containing protein [Geomonas sp. RF6]UFS71091.1 DUF354 domain-containing protein [Geomonas sp. RF6]